MAQYPARGQAAPNYWDLMLKTYIDEGDFGGIAAGGPIFAYGPSYYAYTATCVSNHFNRLRRRLGSKAWANFGVGAFTAGDMSRYAHGAESFNRQGLADDEEDYTSGVGTWDPALNVKGVMLIDPFRNDAGLDGRVADGGTTAKARASAKNSLDSWLRLIRAESITLWTDASFVFTGTWAVLGPVSGTRANALNYTITPGSKFVVTFDGPDIDVNLLALDDAAAGFAGTPFTMKLNGVNYAPAGYPLTTSNQFRKTLMGAAFGIMSIPVRGANVGSNTLEITKGAGAGYLFVDSSMTPSPTPLTVIVEKVSSLTTAGYNSYISLYGAVGAGPAVDAIYDGLIDTVVSRFPTDGSVVVVDYDAVGYNPETMVAKSDNVHRNDVGELFVTNVLERVINALPARDGLVMTG